MHFYQLRGLFEQYALVEILGHGNPDGAYGVVGFVALFFCATATGTLFPLLKCVVVGSAFHTVGVNGQGYCCG